MTNPKPYTVRQYDLSGLKGISDRTLELHFKLYEGYVKETNRLTENIAELLRDGRVAQHAMPAYSELKRRLGFEYNGMVLHEHYFAGLKKGGGGAPSRNSFFLQAVEAAFGTFEQWRTDFATIGTMRGVGWAVCYLDPLQGRLSNHWITLHEVGNVAGFVPVLVMDVWEHAFLLDYAPADRPRYIEAFFANVDWQAVEDRVAAYMLLPASSVAAGRAR